VLLIPSIDLRGGHCVRLLQGDFRRETVYDLDPRELAIRYRNAGAEWLHLVDLDGARDGTLANRGLILELAALSRTRDNVAASAGLRVQVGGGIRSRGIVSDLLAGGVARVVVGSAAIDQPEEVAGWLRDFGTERICLAFDVRVRDGVPIVQTRGWTRESSTSLWEAVARFEALGLRHVLCTDVDRDGAMQGPALALYRDCRERHPTIAWQASGGVRDANDLSSLQTLGMAAAISGKALLEGALADTELRRWLNR
jgi:phosphoribosylformimino-5-aminoimidazole carboxamide ribotide isomerase